MKLLDHEDPYRRLGGIPLTCKETKGSLDDDESIPSRPKLLYKKNESERI
ncbi:Hypothetical protein FKW44_022883 [Caligus rogercresseyi]|uniref:Uncharacterized protein n=1 Tax=Caligus rogercresseyi TaxID=217165 RepID=A0A7T8GP18_CALRO|nr:Hypothetical protein FKW44_022883 [Caligus rogercresseyi]